MKPTLQNFRTWLNGKFIEGKVNNISLTERWIDLFIKECDADHKKTAKPKVVILDDNELSMAKYAEEYPENFKKICNADHKNNKVIGCGKVFHTDLIHKNGTKDILVCRCGGEDGLCEECDANNERCKLSADGKCKGNFSPLNCDGINTPEECKEMLDADYKNDGVKK